MPQWRKKYIYPTPRTRMMHPEMLFATIDVGSTESADGLRVDLGLGVDILWTVLCGSRPDGDRASLCPPQRTEKCLGLCQGVGIAPAPLPGCGMLHVLQDILCVRAQILYAIPPSICTMFLNMYEQSFAKPVGSVMRQCSRRGHQNRNKTFLLFKYLCDLCCASTDKKGCQRRAPNSEVGLKPTRSRGECRGRRSEA